MHLSLFLSVFFCCFKTDKKVNKKILLTNLLVLYRGVVQLVQDRFQGKHDSKPRNDMLVGHMIN